MIQAVRPQAVIAYDWCRSQFSPLCTCNDKNTVEVKFFQILVSCSRQDHSINILHTFLPYLRHNTLSGIESVLDNKL